MKRFSKKRIRNWDAILEKRFFDTSYGFFTVKKAWRAKEYMTNAVAPSGLTSITFYILKIKTDEGATYILPHHHFLEAVWEQEYQKTKNHRR